MESNNDIIQKLVAHGRAKKWEKHGSRCIETDGRRFDLVREASIVSHCSPKPIFGDMVFVKRFSYAQHRVYNSARPEISTLKFKNLISPREAISDIENLSSRDDLPIFLVSPVHLHARFRENGNIRSP